MDINSDKLFKNFKNGLEKLKSEFVSLGSHKLDTKLSIRHPNEIISKIDKLIKNAEIALNSPESYHLNYLYVLCHLESISSLLWALGFTRGIEHDDEGDDF